MYRQGDILLRPVSRLPRSAFLLPDQESARVLAYGEKTGHRHVLTEGHVYASQGPRGQQTFVQVDSPARLVHDEHAMIDVPPGIYEVVRQRTYVPSAAPISRPSGFEPFSTGAFPALRTDDFQSREVSD